MSFAAGCPACGSEVVFRFDQSRLKVCDHCGSIVARQGATLATYGKVADLMPSTSVLRLGGEGRFEGRGFRLAGRLVMRWERGRWDEWAIVFDDGTAGWLSESQGKFHVLREAALPPVPPYADLAPGMVIDLGPPGAFVVAETRRARFEAAEGELPFDARPGTEFGYADLSAKGGRFATLDYGQGEAAEMLFVGREATLAEIGIAADDLKTDEERRARVTGEKLACPQCGGPLELRAPDQTKRVGCPWCGSLLAATGRLEVLSVLEKPGALPVIPLGSAGTFDGVRFTVIGFLVRSVVVDGQRYPWSEYLLYSPEHGFRWLVESSGHWSFVTAVPPGEPRPRGTDVELRGRRYKHFQSANATVDHVLGELYWEVAVGDRAGSDDYIAPPGILSREQEGSELSWSLGSYLEPGAVWSALALPGTPPRRLGVGANQPSPWGASVRPGFVVAGLAIAAMVVVFALASMRGREVVYRGSFLIEASAASGSPEAAVLTPQFTTRRRTNLALRFEAPLGNSWLYIDGALIDEPSGAFTPFDAQLSFYAGTDSDGSWTEGSRVKTVYLGSVSPGTHLLKLDPQWDPSARPASFQVRVTSGVPRLHQLLLAALAVLLWPLLALWRWGRFEQRRWAESDHPWSGGED